MKLTHMFQHASRPAQKPRRPNAIVLLACTFFATAAGAAGFGELTVHSRIGENLLAEVPLLGTGRELTDPSCFTLAPNPGSDLPVVTNARIKLSQTKDGQRLLIIGNRPIAEPLFAISLRANCGIDLRHDYVVMPDAPLAQGEVVESTAMAQGRQRQDKADRAAPAQARQGTKISRQGNGGARRMAMGKPAARQAPSGDRLTLSTAPLDLPIGDSAYQAKAAELEDRLLKMESTLHTLNQQIETLDTSLKLSTEMQSARQELQLAQNMQPTAAVAAPPTTAARQSTSGDWLEMLVSTLLGGSLAVGIAAYLGRHKHPNHPTI